MAVGERRSERGDAGAEAAARGGAVGPRSAAAAPGARARALALLRYAWAGPATAVGLLAAGAWLLCGARARVRNGALEVSGGRLASAVRRLPESCAFCAITLGHVILGTAPDVLDRVRLHEQAHVRQYERWGLLFFPAYAGASVVAWLCARHPYWHNHFECQARREAGEAGEAGEEAEEGAEGDGLTGQPKRP